MKKMSFLFSLQIGKYFFVKTCILNRITTNEIEYILAIVDRKMENRQE